MIGHPLLTFTSGVTVTPPVAAPAAIFWGANPFRRRKKKLEPEEALQIVEQDGTQEERDRAASEARALFARLATAQDQLSRAEQRRIRAERAWVLAVANRIQQERETEQLAVIALLLD